METFTCTIYNCKLSGRSCAARHRKALSQESSAAHFGEEDGKAIIIRGFGNPYSGCVECKAGAERSRIIIEVEPTQPRSDTTRSPTRRAPPRRTTKVSNHVNTNPEHIDIKVLRELASRGALSRTELNVALSKSNTYMKIKLYRLGARELIEVIGKGRASKVQLTDKGWELLRNVSNGSASTAHSGSDASLAYDAEE